MSYETLLALHIGSVILLLGVGGGSAFYKFMADRSKNIEVMRHTNTVVVLVDWIFTTPAIILQPVTGFFLVDFMHLDILETTWLLISIILYGFSICLWFVAVYLQIKMKNLLKNSNSISKEYRLYINNWIILGVFSFVSMLTIYLLMFYKIY